MIGKTLILITLIAAVSCEWYDPSPHAEECKKEENFDPKNPVKMGCFMGCLGKKDQFLNANSEIVVEKFNQWIDMLDTTNKSPMPDDLKTKWKAAGKKCASAAKGKTGNCDVGDTIGDCMKKEGAF